jgi:hypothetical protein
MGDDDEMARGFEIATNLTTKNLLTKVRLYLAISYCTQQYEIVPSRHQRGGVESDFASQGSDDEVKGIVRNE